MPDRNPHTFLNFKGVLDSQVGTILGPNTMGEYLTVVTQDYDVENDKTRLGLVYGYDERG